MIVKRTIYVASLFASTAGVCNAFLSATPPSRERQALPRAGNMRLASDSSSSGKGRLERIEFKIYPDGRVEQKVVGVKGPACLKVTEELNAALGWEVIRTEPTEEMFEEDVIIDQTLTNENVDGSSGDSWEGASSW